MNNRIGTNDVLLGRGGNSYRHTGNVNFRNLAGRMAARYNKATKAEKSRMSKEMVMYVMNMDPPGRFIKRVREHQWEEVSFIVAREKASQCLRDAASIYTNSPGEDDAVATATPPAAAIATATATSTSPWEEQSDYSPRMLSNSHHSLSPGKQFETGMTTRLEHIYETDRWGREKQYYGVHTSPSNFQGQNNTIRTVHNSGRYSPSMTVPQLPNSSSLVHHRHHQHHHPNQPHQQHNQQVQLNQHLHHHQQHHHHQQQQQQLNRQHDGIFRSNSQIPLQVHIPTYAVKPSADLPSHLNSPAWETSASSKSCIELGSSNFSSPSKNPSVVRISEKDKLEFPIISMPRSKSSQYLDIGGTTRGNDKTDSPLISMSRSRSKSFDECLNHKFWEQNAKLSPSESTNDQTTKLELFHSTSRSVNSLDSFARSL